MMQQRLNESLKIRNGLVLLLCLIGFGAFAQPTIEEQQDLDFEILKNLELFELVYKQVDLNYVDDPNPGELMKAAIDAMLYELDPYTNYIPESKIEDYKLMQTGQYGGIGAIIRQVEDEVMIIDPHEGFPAQKNGFQAGDIFVKINDKEVKGLTSSEVSTKLKGKPGTEVSITVNRNGEMITKSFAREEVKFSAVPHYGMINEDIGYIKLNSFTQSAAADVLAAFTSLKETQGMKKLIFDLRGNGGGLVGQATRIVNMFVEKGTKIVSIKGRDESVNQTYVAKVKPEDVKMPMIVLIDGNSASASEIVSGSLQDLDRAVIVGQTSFGKGLVQRPLDLKYNAKLKVTIAKYYTPSGRCIQKLDYSNREFGDNVDEISDSLLNKFTTSTGRIVIDGRGVEPDVSIEEKEFAALTATLVVKNILFDFATKFKRENETISTPKEFKVSDQLYSDFSSYVLSKEFEYTTASVLLLQKLEETAEYEKSMGDVRAEYDALMEKLKPSTEADLKKFRDEIKPLLSDEIVGRYFYQKGRIEHSLVADPFILESIEILNDSERYKKVLNLEN